MSESEFNLLHEPWLMVMYDGGETRSIGLLELFRDAHRIRMLAGETSAQNIAILRLLLAVIYSSHMNSSDSDMSDIEDVDDAVECWKTMWDEGHFDMGIMEPYLMRYESHFYLFDDENPFYQVNIDIGSRYLASKLDGCVLESNNKVKILVVKDGESRYRLTYPEAARWLVHLMSFDDNSAKASDFGKKDSTAVIGGSSAGWLARMGPIYAEGHNLFETLMMNLVLSGDDGEPFENGTVPWELDVPRSAERVQIPCPKCMAEFLTVQARRVMLLRDDGMVTGYRLLGGDIMSTEGALMEQMTLWKLVKTDWKPKIHDPSRMLWRDFSALLVRVDDSGTSCRTPGLVTWLSMLIGNGVLKYGSINFRTAGLQYDDKYFFVKDIIDDGLTFNSDMMNDMNVGWNRRIGDLIVDIESGIKYLGRFSADLAICCGRDPDSAKANDAANARARGYQAMDLPFRTWLASIDPSSDDIDERMTEGKEMTYDVLLGIGRSIFENSSERALIGKTSGTKGGDNAFKAFSKFNALIYHILKKEEKK